MATNHDSCNDATAPDGFYTLGEMAVRDELVEAFCSQTSPWFSDEGELRDGNPLALDKSRERMWCAMNFLAHADPVQQALGNHILERTPIELNAFQPTIAAELLLVQGHRLSAAAETHLRAMIQQHLLTRIEHTLAVEGITNFACMGAWFFVAASRLFDRYRVDARFALPEPAVYSSHRLAAMGRNVLRMLAHEAEHCDVPEEFNSPTYTPISLACMAKIVEHATDEQTRRLALQIETKLWREALAMFHPHLNLSCGPYSRAYRQTILGQVTQMRQLLAYVGLSRDRSIPAMFLLDDPDLFVQRHDGRPMINAAPIWLTNTRYHVPCDAVDELRKRRFPACFHAMLPADAHGLIELDPPRWVPVQGDAIPARPGYLEQVQHEHWALGYRSQCRRGHSFPAYLHYARRRDVTDMRDVRTVTAGVLFHGQAEQWKTNAGGERVEAHNFNHDGDLTLYRDGQTIHWEGHPFTELAPLPADEISINAFIPLHFTKPDRVWINDQCWTGEPLSVATRQATCRVEDAGFVYELMIDLDCEGELRLFRWANFLRFAGVIYQGPARTFTAQALASMTVRGNLRVLSIP